MPLITYSSANFFCQCLGRNNRWPPTRNISYARTPWQEKYFTFSAAAALWRVERHSQTYPAGNLVPAQWRTIQLCTTFSKLSAYNISQPMDCSRWFCNTLEFLRLNSFLWGELKALIYGTPIESAVDLVDRLRSAMLSSICLLFLRNFDKHFFVVVPYV